MSRNVLIVGGGPAGLLLAYHLREQGIDYKVLERGKIAQSWRSMRPGMVLLSPAVPGTDWTSLTLKHPIWALPRTRRPFPSREDFLCYVEAFARENGLNVAENTAVMRVSAEPGKFIASTTGGEESCRFLVLASGASTEPAFPDVPGIGNNPRVVHSCDFVNCTAYAGKRVLVVGGGNSAAEIAIDLAGTATVTMCTRGPIRYFSETGNLEDIRGASESVLKELFKFGIVRLREDDPVVSVSYRRISYRGGDEREYDWIMCATGYRPKCIPLSGGELRVDPDGYPAISNAGETSVPGLYACGSLARFNRRCAFIHGFRNYVENVLWDIADRL
ncbi:MAG: NAD(P)-binding domain-containing protein [Deltaproteobacteria bacterium]|nr:NAD(P)-binding domain-containing protein [Deltaproteobacteria bacterium]